MLCHDSFEAYPKGNMRVAEAPFEVVLFIRQPTNLEKAFCALTQSLLKTSFSLVNSGRKCLIFIPLKPEREEL